MDGTLQSIQQNAFSGCTSLKTLDLGGSSIAQVSSGFISGTKIQQLVLPPTINSVGSISPSAFSGVTLTSITLKGMTSAYMTAHKDEFNRFGASANFELVSSDNVRY